MKCFNCKRIKLVERAGEWVYICTVKHSPLGIIRKLIGCKYYIDREGGTPHD